ncbi:spermatogenesis-defective protein 39 homolog isoform X3 [Hydractinia symbiolongicarpus]|nr:spermatogenesis-defective protein 39 homolog isoform X3 [Hydractinia symbiolongicarpus]
MSRANPFDFNEDEATKQFEKNIIFGVSPHDSSYVSAHDFMKKSLAAANMLNDEEDDLSQITATNQAVAFSKKADEIDSRPASRSFSKSSDAAHSARGQGSRPSSYTKEGWSSKTPSFTTNYQSIDDIVHNKPQVSGSDYQHLQDELIKAKKMIETLKYEKWSSLPVKETVNRLVVGKPYALEGYRALSQKQELLDAAVKSRDGNAISTVIIFLEKTLKPTLFYREIQKRPIAVRHFIQYLRKHEKWEKLEDFYNIFYFRHTLLLEEAAYLRYEQVNLKKILTDRMTGLNNWIRDYGLKPEASELASYVKDELTLLEKQKILEEEDKVRAAASTDTVMKYHPRISIELKSLMTTISYCALYHYDKTSAYYPEKFKKDFKITNKQYEWAVLPPRANLHRWADIQELLTSSGFLGFKKGESSNMGFEQVVSVLHKARANEEILTKYLNLISNSDLRLKFAEKCGMHDVAIETLVQMRDRRGMEEYRLKIGSSSKYRQKINDLLNNSQIKWR